jgi:siderophore synthetase component
LAHDLESPVTAVGFVAVRRDLHVGDEIDLGLDFADVDRGRYAVTPVHAWQLGHLAEGRYAELFADGALVRLDAELPALATGALRTLLLPDHGVSVKVSLDIQVTSTRRTISVASTRNGPVLSDLLARLLPECGDRVMLMPETAGSAAVTPLGERDLSAIVRPGLAGRLEPGEVAIPGSALYAVSPLTGSTVVAELIERYARSAESERERGRGPDRSAAAREWLAAYARLVLPPVLRMATRHGIGLEAHLQNCVPTFVDGRPHRLAVRDLAGMRVYPGRLAQAEHTPLWPGSVIVADSVDVMRSKVAYTVLQAHLGELVLQLGRSHGLDERLAWADVRSVVDEVFDELAAEPALAERARADHAFLTAPTVPHKALLGMRLAAVQGRGGDIYVRVGNPLR